MQFYFKEGTEIRGNSNVKEFINTYNKSYYLDEKRIVPGVSQTSRFIEDEIDCLLKRGIKTKEDVVHIMAWKMGKVKHKDSQEESEKAGKVKFVYASKWEGAENFDAGRNPTVQRYGKDFNLGELATYVAEHITELEVQAKDDPQSVLDKLKNQNISGLGPVYLITLLYFISRGKYPIYDQFAVFALEAISGGKKPGDKVEFHALPDKSSKRFGAIMQTEMKSYINSIMSIFGSAYWENRDIDRALWVYGHMFSKQ